MTLAIQRRTITGDATPACPTWCPGTPDTCYTETPIDVGGQTIGGDHVHHGVLLRLTTNHPDDDGPQQVTILAERRDTDRPGQTVIRVRVEMGNRPHGLTADQVLDTTRGLDSWALASIAAQHVAGVWNEQTATLDPQQRAALAAALVREV
jgi:hypothetical protein